MIKYSIINKRGKSKEFDYLWFWPEGYEYVDARYCNIRVSRSSSLYNYKRYLYKLWYLNPDMTEDDAVNDGINMIQTLLNADVSILLVDSDIYEIAFEVFNGDIPVDISDIVKDVSRIEWKRDISGLIKMTEDDFYKIHGGEYKTQKEIYNAYIEYVRSKKVTESLKCINIMKLKTMKEKVMATILAVKQENEGVCSILDVSRELNISFKTAQKYCEACMHDVTLQEYAFVSNKNNLARDNSLATITECIKILNAANMKVTKSAVHKATGLSRVTIDKYWDKL